MCPSCEKAQKAAIEQARKAAAERGAPGEAPAAADDAKGFSSHAGQGA
jgi:hypothetical protein